MFKKWFKRPKTEAQCAIQNVVNSKTTLSPEELDKARVAAYIDMWKNAPEVYPGIKMLSNGNKETDCLPYLK